MTTSSQSMSKLPAPPRRPCGSCPYRTDVPSGVWHADEYAKLTKYDGDTIEQILAGAIGLFFCHQRDGCICGGWLQTYDPDQLAALRMNRVDPACFEYQSDVPTFASGREAAEHGLRDIDAPSADAQKLMRKIGRLPGVKS